MIWWSKIVWGRMVFKTVKSILNQLRGLEMKKEKECTRCGGKGKITMLNADLSSISYKMICSECGGKGKVKR